MSHSFGGCKSDIKVLSGLVPSEAVREGSDPGLSPCLVDVCLHVHMAFSLNAYLLQISPFYNDTMLLNSSLAVLHSKANYSRGKCQ